MQLIPLEKIHSSRDSVRKARESHLIDKAMTLEPRGLNRRGDIIAVYILSIFPFQFLCCTSFLTLPFIATFSIYNIVIVT